MDNLEQAPSERENGKDKLQNLAKQHKQKTKKLKGAINGLNIKVELMKLKSVEDVLNEIRRMPEIIEIAQENTATARSDHTKINSAKHNLIIGEKEVKWLKSKIDKIENFRTIVRDQCRVFVMYHTYHQHSENAYAPKKAQDVLRGRICGRLGHILSKVCDERIHKVQKSYIILLGLFSSKEDVIIEDWALHALRRAHYSSIIKNLVTFWHSVLYNYHVVMDYIPRYFNIVEI